MSMGKGPQNAGCYIDDCGRDLSGRPFTEQAALLSASQFRLESLHKVWKYH